MKKLIITSLSLLPMIASAEVVLYGQIRAGYEVNATKFSKSTDTDKSYHNGVADWNSRIGFKGEEDLNNGLKAIWQYETRTPVTGSGTSPRDSFIGLQSPYGTFKAGYVSNYHLAPMGGKNSPNQFLSSSINSVLSIGRFVRGEARYHSIRYDSPDLSGFSGTLQYSPRDNRDDTLDSRVNNHKGKTSEVLAGGMNYQNSGYFIRYGIDYLKNNSPVDSGADGQIHRAEIGYDANNLLLVGAYQRAKNFDKAFNPASPYARYLFSKAGKGAASGISTQEVAVTAAYRIGNIVPTVTYAHGWDVKTTCSNTADCGGLEKGSAIKNTSYSKVIVGAQYLFSKRTWLYGHVAYLEEGLGLSKGYTGKSLGKARTVGSAVGLRHFF
ncbi:porin [Stenoxybacter acetivorans]|uniref:porin n=1 Tax=Stenoxybacter acetivorans TaxID=422441 RepID=UPI000A001F3A|nr:porin [Stenoxybacter acetivorans]